MTSIQDVLAQYGIEVTDEQLQGLMASRQMDIQGHYELYSTAVQAYFKFFELASPVSRYLEEWKVVGGKH